jgi:hypothetical protein
MGDASYNNVVVYRLIGRDRDRKFAHDAPGIDVAAEEQRLSVMPGIKQEVPSYGNA